MTLGERIQAALSGTPLSVRDIASRCGVSVQAVYKWQRGDVKNIEPGNLFILEDLTGYSARWIGTGDRQTNRLVRFFFICRLNYSCFLA